jgi:hypothetical protein
MIKLKILFIGFLLIQLNSSCSEKFATTEMENNFTAEQIDDLKKIRDFFENQICEKKGDDFENCFSKMLPELIEFGWQPILEKIDYNKQKELYESISMSTFNEIWEFQKIIYPESENELKSIASKYNGGYQKYLTELGVKNSQIRDYAKRLIKAGDFESMGLLQQNIYQNPNEFDLSDANIQILISVHYLTQNDQQKRNE